MEILLVATGGILVALYGLYRYTTHGRDGMPRHTPDFLLNKEVRRLRTRLAQKHTGVYRILAGVRAADMGVESSVVFDIVAFDAERRAPNVVIAVGSDNDYAGMEQAATRIGVPFVHVKDSGVDDAELNRLLMDALLKAAGDKY